MVIFTWVELLWSQIHHSCLCYLTSLCTMCSYFEFCWEWGSLILAWSCWFQCLLNNKLIHNICSNICVYSSKFVSTKSISLTSGDCYIHFVQSLIGWNINLCFDLISFAVKYWLIMTRENGISDIMYLIINILFFYTHISLCLSWSHSFDTVDSSN